MGKEIIQKWYTAACRLMQRLYTVCRFHKGSHAPYEFLPSYLELVERPPSPTARITAVAISVFVLLSLIWAYSSKIEIYARASGHLMVPSRSQIIQSYEAGEIVQILVDNGQEVKAGDALLVLNVVGLAQEIRRCQEQLSFQQLELVRYRALLNDHSLSALMIPNDLEKSIVERASAYLHSMRQDYQAALTAFDAELAMNQSEQIVNQTSIAGLQKLLHNIQQRLIPIRKLVKRKFESKVPLLIIEKEALKTKLSISVKQKEWKVLQARAEVLRKNRASYIVQKHREWHDHLNKATSNLLIAEQELEKVEDRSRLQRLRAPLDGIVQQLSVHTIGGIVQGAQTLMIITPHGASQQAEIDIANKYIGFIHPGQSVTVKIEAFPYSSYGTINGKIVSLSHDAVKKNASTNAELVFPAQIALAQNHILIHTKRVALTPGMAITAEIKIGKRRIINYLLRPLLEYKAEVWREP